MSDFKRLDADGIAYARGIIDKLKPNPLCDVKVAVNGVWVMTRESRGVFAHTFFEVPNGYAEGIGRYLEDVMGGYNE